MRDGQSFGRFPALLLFLIMGALVLLAFSMLLLVDLRHAAGDAVQGFLLLCGAIIGAGAILMTWSGWRAARRRMRAMHRALRELEHARRRMETASREKDRLLATITHELRTPMNGVIGMADLLLDTPLTEEQKSYVQAISASGRSLLSMIDELLEAARAEAVEVPVARAPFDLVRVVEEVCELLAPRAHARGLDLVCFIDPALRGKRLGDAARIRQVLLNLAGNAVKFTESGGVQVRVLPERGDLIRFEVHDTGIGIDPRHLGEIFEPFRRIEGERGNAGSGTGLGLAISRRLVERMGGRLAAESVPGKGSIFRFSLPLPGVGEEEGFPAAASGLRGVVVHLVMPESPRRSVLADYVKAWGGDVRHVLPEHLPELLASPQTEGMEIVCDAEHADILREMAGRRECARGLARTWLLLKPEQRRELSDLVQGGRLAGFLLMPLRRRTFLVQFVERSLDARLDDSVQELRTVLAEHRGGERKTEGAPLVLLVEDNDINALLAERLLQRLGCRVKRLRDGDRAVSLMEEVLAGKAERPSLVLMDVHMPGMDGLEAVQRIRALEARYGARRIPVHALTANPGEDERARCMAAGMDGFLVKPVDPDKLARVVGAIRPDASAV